MRRVAAILALSIGTLLSGCFASYKPMFAPESAVRALESGRYGLFEQYGDQSKPSEYMEVRLRDNVYDFVNEKGAVNPVTFHPIAGGLYVAQVGGMPQLNTDKKATATRCSRSTAAKRSSTWSNATSRKRRCSPSLAWKSAASTNASSIMSQIRPRSLPGSGEAIRHQEWCGSSFQASA